jgi:hypothetical protein
LLRTGCDVDKAMLPADETALTTYGPHAPIAETVVYADSKPRASRLISIRMNLQSPRAYAQPLVVVI